VQEPCQCMDVTSLAVRARARAAAGLRQPSQPFKLEMTGLTHKTADRLGPAPWLGMHSGLARAPEPQRQLHAPRRSPRRQRSTCTVCCAGSPELAMQPAASQPCPAGGRPARRACASEAPVVPASAGGCAAESAGACPSSDCSWPGVSEALRWRRTRCAASPGPALCRRRLHVGACPWNRRPCCQTSTDSQERTCGCCQRAPGARVCMQKDLTSKSHVVWQRSCTD